MDRRTFLRRFAAPSAEALPAPDYAPLTPPPVTTGLEPYAGPWTEKEASHLLRRTHFGLTRADLVDALFYAPGQAVDRIVDRALARPLPGAPSWYNTTTQNGGQNTQWIYEWQQGWYAEMRAGGLREKVAFLWHDHFSTQHPTYVHAAFAYQYLTLLRQRGLGPFRPLLEGVGLLPAMLIYLDGQHNQVGDTNENYARELLELFSMGILGPDGQPNYTQQDIEEAARALTGYVVNLSTLQAQFVPARHDSGPKTIFGQTAAFNYASLHTLLFQQRATQIAHFIAKKLYAWFVFPAPNTAVVSGLAARLLANNFDVADALRLLLKSAHFFDETFYGARLKDPTELMVGFLRAMEIPAPTPVLSYFRDVGFMLGQELLNPPNVSGWPGYSPDQYRAWITTGTIPDRTGLAEAAIHGGGPFDTFDPFPFIQQHSDPTNARTLARDLANHLLPVPVTEADVDVLIEILLEGAPVHEWIVIYVNTPETARTRLRALLTHLANLPEFQLT